jgi:hypothetical protein
MSSPPPRRPGYGASVKHANSGLRFALELAMLASLGYYGFAQFDGIASWLLGLGLPIVAATVWGVFVSPKASHPTEDPVRIVLEIALLGSGPVALAAADNTGLAVIAGVLVAIHLGLTFVLDQRTAPAL